MTHGISIVSGTYNRLNLLQTLIASVRDSIPAGIRYEIIIVDGGSTDGTQAWCKEQSDVTLIEQGELTGAITAFTLGAYKAQYDYVILANDDIVFAYPDAILKAILHLEENPTCGAVAFADNRPVPPYYPDNRHWHVLKAPAVYKGERKDVNYAQVGMFRKTLGDKVNWWRGHKPEFAHSRTYAGDNMISSSIWELGYSIDAVDGCKVDDLVIEDELRAFNRSQNPDLDSRAYYDSWHNAYGIDGAVIPDNPGEPVDKRKLRILYLPIFETNQEPHKGKSVQQLQKRGLREALARVAWVWEYDYINAPKKALQHELVHILQTFKPDILFTQVHGANDLTYDILKELRAMRPTMMCINWNGDTHRSNLVNPEMLKWLTLVDLQLSVNHSVVEYYNSIGIPSAYWQCSFEPVDEPLPDVPSYDVIFQGTNYAEQRGKMGVMLKEMLGDRFGVYGDWWDRVGIEANGRTLYDFRLSTALYRNAKIAIGSNEFPDDYGFVSNRLWEAMAAGNCLCLFQHIIGLEELTGVKAGIHYIEWDNLADLRQHLEYWLDNPNQRDIVASEGTQFVRTYHSFDARVKELFTELLPLAKKKLQNFVALKYTGQSKEQLGILATDGKHITVNPDELLYVSPEDADYIIRMYGVFERTSDVSKTDSLASAAVLYG